VNEGDEGESKVGWTEGASIIGVGEGLSKVLWRKAEKGTGRAMGNGSRGRTLGT
jgi:hypothetical protein